MGTAKSDGGRVEGKKTQKRMVLDGRIERQSRRIGIARAVEHRKALQ